MQKSSTHTALRERFNPEGSLLRRQQERMLTLLDILDGVCKKHNIPYWLSSGTLIGAARHGGFIPWDDDLDVEMLRKDYLRLLKILPGELPKGYVWQTNETDPGYFFNFGKLRETSSHLEEPNPYLLSSKYKGIYIDVFPIEHAPYPLAWVGGHLQGRIFKVFKDASLNEATKLIKAQQIFNFNKRCAFPILRFLAKWWPGGVLRHSFGTAYFKPRRINDIFPLSEMKFEGKKYPVPGHTDTVLQRIYGDYMKIPNLDSIKPHLTHLELFDPQDER